MLYILKQLVSQILFCLAYVFTLNQNELQTLFVIDKNKIIT